MDMSRFTAVLSLPLVFLCACMLLSVDWVYAADLSNPLLEAAELGEIDKVKGLIGQVYGLMQKIMMAGPR